MATVHWHRNEAGDECRSRGPAGMGCGGQSKGAALGMESEPVLRQPIHHLLVSLLTPTPHPLQAITDFRSWCCLLTGWGAQYKRCSVGSVTRKQPFFKTIFSILTIGKFRIWRKWLQVSVKLMIFFLWNGGQGRSSNTDNPLQQLHQMTSSSSREDTFLDPPHLIFKRMCG